MSNYNITAHMRMEERYETLSLIFENREDLCNDVKSAIDKVKAETGMTPFIFEKISKDRADLHGIYIEFHDDIHRVGGGFFTKLLNELNIDKCEADI
ncbi:hypothetical protein MNB_SV-13-20 [hydrothermal vent metagenome]|uniref:Uncharacterized protein n=1 Tax=hydrothermal vent metagenome TaxID=652676 RepID=A0A1W1BQI9_9ZZZZ